MLCHLLPEEYCPGIDYDSSQVRRSRHLLFIRRWLHCTPAEAESSRKRKQNLENWNNTQTAKSRKVLVFFNFHNPKILKAKN